MPPGPQHFDMSAVAQRLQEEAYRLLAALPLLLLALIVVWLAWLLGS
jgi:small conductance mechanosensitive channel